MMTCLSRYVFAGHAVETALPLPYTLVTQAYGGLSIQKSLYVTKGHPNSFKHGLGLTCVALKHLWTHYNDFVLNVSKNVKLC